MEDLNLYLKDVLRVSQGDSTGIIAAVIPKYLTQ